jgi:hypothetical protein
MVYGPLVLHNVYMIARPVRRVLPLLALTSLWVDSAHASLGSDANSVASDAEQLHGIVQPATLGQARVLEIVTDNGMHVREFLNQQGVVFALTWEGPVMPDLQQLLGAGFPAYSAALAAHERPGLHRSVRVATAELVVESNGHLRAYAGRAYLPALLPAGVSLPDLR